MESLVSKESLMQIQPRSLNTNQHYEIKIGNRWFTIKNKKDRLKVLRIQDRYNKAKKKDSHHR